MEWWMWLAGGLALVVAELATPSGFFIIFFGLGALTVGVLGGLGMAVDILALQSCCSPSCRSPRCCCSAAGCRPGCQMPAAAMSIR